MRRKEKGKNGGPTSCFRANVIQGLDRPAQMEPILASELPLRKKIPTTTQNHVCLPMGLTSMPHLQIFLLSTER